MSEVTILDCTLRDGGYYNAWDFDPELVSDYLAAMSAAKVDVVELGQRFLSNSGFKGPHAYTTDEFLRTLDIPEGLRVAVMVNGSDLLRNASLEQTLAQLFPESGQNSPVDIVRIACHLHEIADVLPASEWLTQNGYTVGVNLMQIADRTKEEVVEVARTAARYPVEVLYFADSMGSMAPEQTAEIVSWLREGWSGPIGIHTHDNMGLALQNSQRAAREGVSWLDATVTGMGRGPGNARTEELVIAFDERRGEPANLVPLLTLIRKHLQPMKEHYGWGTNPFYFLSGKYGIHPTYIQEMVGDSRYDEEDILAVIEYLRQEGGKKYSSASLDAARAFYSGDPEGIWAPETLFAGREVLLLGTGPGALRHRDALQSYIERERPLVLALNTQAAIKEDLIDLRVACHPVRMLADTGEHLRRRQPLITPFSMLPESIRARLAGKEILDFGLSVQPGKFEGAQTYCVAPSSIVLAYALAIAASGKARNILMAGFDGYPAGDARNEEIDALLALFEESFPDVVLTSVLPTIYKISQRSIYGL